MFITEQDETTPAEVELLSSLAIQKDALQWINHEVYNNIGQVLSLAKLKVSQLHLNRPEAALAETGALLGKSISDLRLLGKCLLPEQVVDQPFEDSLKHELNLCTKFNGLVTRLDIRGRPIELSPGNKLILVRVFKEVQSNTIRHARADQFFVTVHFRKKDISIKLEDNGLGFDVAGPRMQVLKSVEKSIHVLGGVLTVRSRRGKGTTVGIQVPY